jgi:hypothetical protein
VALPASETQRFAAAVRLVRTMSGEGAYCVCMSTDGIGKFREMADVCRRRAEQAVRPLDREGWLRAAGEWTELAQTAEKRVGKHPDVRREI